MAVIQIMLMGGAAVFCSRCGTALTRKTAMAGVCCICREAFERVELVLRSGTVESLLPIAA
jgi:hypothetical protein